MKTMDAEFNQIREALKQGGIELTNPAILEVWKQAISTDPKKLEQAAEQAPTKEEKQALTLCGTISSLALGGAVALSSNRDTAALGATLLASLLLILLLSSLRDKEKGKDKTEVETQEPNQNEGETVPTPNATDQPQNPVQAEANTQTPPVNENLKEDEVNQGRITSEEKPKKPKSRGDEGPQMS